MRIVITGSGGMLGTDLCKILADKYELHGIDLKPTPITDYRLPITDHKIDITDAQKTYEVVTKINPELVIHTAAWTEVDDCEVNPEKAYKVNALGTRNIALACQRFDTVLIYVSTDFVFDGNKTTPYLEYDQPNPQSVYARSKYWGELYVQWLLNKFYIIRTSWLFGKNGKNFVHTILNLAKKKDEINVVCDQVGCPTWTKDLSASIAQLISPVHQTLPSVGKGEVNGLYGVWHLTNAGSCSWYEFAKEIIQKSKVQSPMSNVRVKAISSERLGRPAPRPKYSVLANSGWQLEGFKPLRHWKEALKDYLATMD